ncbi:MAG: hypothetical protein Q7T05_03490, partial [Dehalococcoidia bacterium]|nr:hypothetical protein [Dehalococcoidia bacterium]
GREVRQLTNLPQGARVHYFRQERHLQDGRIIAWYAHENGSASPRRTDIMLIDPESGDVEFPKHRPGAFLAVLNSGKAVYTTGDEKREVWAMTLPDGGPELIGSIPQEAPGALHSPRNLHNITCDGRTILLVSAQIPQPAGPLPCTDDVNDSSGFWRHIYRPRSGDLYAYNLDDETFTCCVHLDRCSFQHIDPSPSDPGLVKFAQDVLGVFEQRAWTVRTDGSELRKIKPQRKGEWVHHEFWWPDGQFIGYKYVDRRNDPTVHELPWGELAPRPLQLGIADLTGREVYLSEPLCCFQSHLFVSPKGDMVSGEGTLGHSFVYAAPFSWSDYDIDLQPLATVHTPYNLGSAQSVEAGFSADSRWLIYNDTVDGKFQVCAVRV